LTGLDAEDAAYPVDDAATPSSLAQYQQQEEDHRQGELLDGALHCVVLLHLHFLWRNPPRPRPAYLLATPTGPPARLPAAQRPQLLHSTHITVA